MSVAFKGFNEKVLTLQTSATISAGTPVSMSSNATVTSTSSGDAFIGIAGSQRGNYIDVHLNGYVKSSYTGTAPTVGKVTLGANGSGGVKVVASGGTTCLVLNVDSTNSTVEYLI